MAFQVKAVGGSGGRTGGRGKGEAGGKGAKRWEIRRTESNATLQTANLGKGQWFVAGFMGIFLKRENSDPVCLSKEFIARNLFLSTRTRAALGVD